ncbi:assimilatory nitrate reductase catalytic subunit [Paenibacillus endophyticus]|uniref:Assimilatory nitrate reductase catalytic subunit n=1 Tax=Paenibacillus endophyticus TaxID=1294268 RepID=A0A7W5G9A0_9BACL|nr:molybdopterin oxidoreductase family protein [Paenibacillus endophyticus]MBB3151510.1 assimilatory nitrate reductase catalytic subunit [Paenibacillus endophyticus]
MRQLLAATEVNAGYTMDTQCPFCSVQCKMRITKELPIPGSRRFAYSIEGIPNAASEGRLCVKGMNAHQHATSKERLMQPLIKKNGELVPSTWEEAMSLIEERFQEGSRAFGPHSLGVYGGGSLTNESAYLLGKFARVALGTKYIDYNGRFCMSAAASAGNKTFGIDRGLTCRLADIPLARCIIMAGTNIAECQPTLMPYFNKAKENGATIIVIDPRATATAAIADMHLQLKTGTDAALANGMLKVLLEENLIDEAFIAERTNGFAELAAHLAAVELKDIAELTGVEENLIRNAARAYGAAETGIVLTARGVEQQTDGHVAVRNFLNMVIATGKIGKPGCGYGAVTGQGNGQGGREHGQKSDQLPGYRNIEDENDRAYVASVWDIHPDELPRKGVSAYEMMELVHHREIRTLLVMGSNPVVSNPNADLVEEALRNLDFLVVADMFLSETAVMADVVLPVTAYLENDGTLTNLEGRVLLRESTIEPPGETKHDWQILCDIAERLGKKKYFPFVNAEQIFNELRVASKGGLADYYGITYDRLRTSGGIYWPCTSTEEDGNQGMMFEHAFAHSDGKAIFFPVASRTPQETPNEEFPLTMTNGRVLSHYLTGVQTRRSHTLAARNVENYIEIHPKTAKRHHIIDGEWVEVTSRRGSFSVRSRFSDKIREDTLFVPMHWGGIQNVNKATSPELDPNCKMPGFKTSTVSITPLRLKPLAHLMI